MIKEVRFYDGADDGKLKFAVILARSGGKLVFCRHRDRTTLEIPGGRREPGERIEETGRKRARRNLPSGPCACTPWSGTTRRNPSADCTPPR